MPPEINSKKPTKKRNHFIPQVLLRRFASRAKSQKRQFWTWEISENSSREILTNNAAVASYFYGQPETGLEAAFGVEETRLGEILVQLDKGIEPDRFYDDLRMIFWQQTFRTRALRMSFSDAANTLLDQMQEKIFSSSSGNDYFANLIRSNFDLLLDRSIASSDLTEYQKRRMKDYFKPDWIREAYLPLVLDQLNKTDEHLMYGNLVIENIKALKIVATATEDGHVRALSRILEERTLPDTFKPKSYSIISSENSIFILGDACTFARSEDGEIGHTTKFGDAWNEMYLPISSRHCLVGCMHSAQPKLTPHEVNRASAQLAYQYIYAADNGDSVKELQSIIGEKRDILTRDEIEKMVLEIVSDRFPKLA